MTEKVVVAVDGSPGSEAALDWAIARARTTPVEFELTTVIDLGFSPTKAAETSVRPTYERVLADAATRIGEALPGTSVLSTLRRGAPRRELIFASATADLLVIGTHEPTGVFHGILPLQLAAASTSPVVVVPAGWAPRNGAVVIGVDDDETSEVALAFAAAEAVRLRTSLKLVHTWSIPYPLMINPYGLSPDAVDISQDAHQLVLDRAVEFVGREYPNLVVHPILRQGSPATELVDVASTAELLVVGTHRRGVIPAMLLGSVSHNVLVNVPCPVVVAPHPEEKQEHRREREPRREEVR